MVVEYLSSWEEIDSKATAAGRAATSQRWVYVIWNVTKFAAAVLDVFYWD